MWQTNARKDAELIGGVGGEDPIARRWSSAMCESDEVHACSSALPGYQSNISTRIFSETNICKRYRRDNPSDSRCWDANGCSFVVVKLRGVLEEHYRRSSRLAHCRMQPAPQFWRTPRSASHTTTRCFHA